MGNDYGGAQGHPLVTPVRSAAPGSVGLAELGAIRPAPGDCRSAPGRIQGTAAGRCRQVA
jgi:hypothetical protein